LKAQWESRRLSKARTTAVAARLGVICPIPRWTFSSQRNFRAWESEKAL